MTPTRVYISGKFYDKADAKISVYDHGLLYGDGVFEGIRIYDGKVFKLREHVDRLFESARAIKLEIPLSREQMTRAIQETVAVNGKRNGYIRPIVTRGAGTLGLDPRKTTDPQVIIIVDDIALYPPELYDTGLEIATVATMRNHPAAMNPRIKSLNYLNNILAKIEGIQQGCLESLMLNHKGEIAECSGDNIFLVKTGVLYTPPIDAGILKGITRDTVIELARSEGPHRGGVADPARRVHRRRVLPDRQRGRDHPGRQVRRPRHRQRQARTDDETAARGVSSADADVIDCSKGDSIKTSSPGSSAAWQRGLQFGEALSPVAARAS